MGKRRTKKEMLVAPTFFTGDDGLDVPVENCFHIVGPPAVLKGLRLAFHVADFSRDGIGEARNKVKGKEFVFRVAESRAVDELEGPVIILTRYTP